MATFELEHNGRTFEVESPDLATAVQDVRRWLELPETPPAPGAWDVLRRVGEAAWNWSLPGVAANVGLAAGRYAAENPREAGRMGAQFVGTGAGIIGGGAVAGLPGAVGGGAAGNVASRQIYDAVLDWLRGTQQRPDVVSIESGVDAAAGALGPVLGRLAKPAARIATGLEAFGPAEQAQVRAVQKAAEDAARAMGLPAGRGREIAELALAEHARNSSAERLSRGFLSSALGQTPGPSSLAGLVTSLATGNITHGIAVAAGVFGGRHVAARTLLNNPRFVEWAYMNGNNISTPAQLGAALASLAASEGLAPADRDAFIAGAREFGGTGSTSGPTLRRLGRQGREYIGVVENGRVVRKATAEDLRTLGEQ